MLSFSKSEMVTAVELGTSKVCVMIGAYDKSDDITVLGYGEMPVGDGIVRKGVIEDVEKISGLFKDALELAEASAKIQVGQENVFLGVSGQHVKSNMGIGSVTVAGIDSKITERDIAEACSNASVERLPDDMELDSIVNRYVLDGKRECGNPLNQTAFKLDVHSHNISCDRNVLETFRTPLYEIGFERSEPIFNGIASASATVSDEEHEKGVVFLDYGAGVTEYLLLLSPGVLASGVIPIGTDHLVSDLSVAFELPVSPACRGLLMEFAGDMRKDIPKNRIFEVKTSQGPRKISFDNIEKVISLRMREMFEIIKDRLAATGALETVGNSVVITGGGASFPMTEELAGDVFGLPTRIAGKTIHEDFNGALTNLESPRYSTLLGLLKYGLMRTKQPTTLSKLDKSLTSFFKKALKNTVKAIKI
ncbi:MAG: cell division protein FtsA [Kiritimatiellaeota bacterium]|nr:cell division protein FtsA [Kiritimatiellota bacterium]